MGKVNSRKVDPHDVFSPDKSRARWSSVTIPLSIVSIQRRLLGSTFPSKSALDSGFDEMGFNLIANASTAV